jgi:hypothetical protein
MSLKTNSLENCNFTVVVTSRYKVATSRHAVAVYGHVGVLPQVFHDGCDFLNKNSANIVTNRNDLFLSS